MMYRIQLWQGLRDHMDAEEQQKEKYRLLVQKGAKRERETLAQAEDMLNQVTVTCLAQCNASEQLSQACFQPLLVCL